MTDIADPYFFDPGADDGAHLAGRVRSRSRRTSWRSPRSSSSSSSTSSKWRCCAAQLLQPRFLQRPADKNEAAFWIQLLTIFLPFAMIYIAALVVEYVVTSNFVYRWRRWLSAYYIGHWLGGGAHYPMALAGTRRQTPTTHQRGHLRLHLRQRLRRRHLRLFD